MTKKYLLAGVAALALLNVPLLPQTDNWIVGTAQAQSAAISVGEALQISLCLDSQPKFPLTGRHTRTGIGSIPSATAGISHPMNPSHGPSITMADGRLNRRWAGIGFLGEYGLPLG